MPLQPNPSLYIPFEFVDEDKLTHTARSWEELAAKLADYRRRNKKPPGEPLEEVLRQACERYPDRCYGTKTGARPQGRLSMRILSWLARVVDKPKFVSSEEAARRTEICRACSRQKSWVEEENCANCRKTINNVVGGLLSEAKAPDSKTNLQGCDVLGEDTRISVWMEQAAAGGLPEHCWRK